MTPKAIQNFRCARQKTAIRRHKYSRPVSCALSDGIIDQTKNVFDYGCGHGEDVALLRKAGIQSSGWDPAHKASTIPIPADVVNLGYVVNVIEERNERRETLRKAWSLTGQVLVVSAQLTMDAKTKNVEPYKDGYLTKRGTFQKYFEQHELRQWIGDVLGEGAVPAAPGIFYVFRDGDAKEAFVSSRYRRAAAVPRLRKADELFEKHRNLLQPIMDFYAARGRLPEVSEVQGNPELVDVFGSAKRAFRVISVVTDASQWEKIRDERSQDLLVYLALARFDGRKKFSELPISLQLDVKSFFSNYKRACELSDALLFGCGNQETIDEACAESPVGKLTPSALYVHESALAELSPLLRAYEGCAKSYVGMIEGANIVKLHRREPKISYLTYPKFDKDPHPSLSASFSVNLQTFRFKQRRYADSLNPPILHRKELFVPETYVGREKFARLTKSEEKAGLYEKTSRIGRQNEWEALLKEKGGYLKGHLLFKQRK